MLDGTRVEEHTFEPDQLEVEQISIYNTVTEGPWVFTKENGPASVHLISNEPDGEILEMYRNCKQNVLTVNERGLIELILDCLNGGVRTGSYDGHENVLKIDVDSHRVKRAILIALFLFTACTMPSPDSPKTNTSIANASGSEDEQCANFTRDGEEVRKCATCGNDECEDGETCTSSVVNSQDGGPAVATNDCGPLYCPEDCSRS